MSEDKKPKKDLRARLGRTIAPNTPGAAPIAPPSGAAGAGVIAPPAAAPVAAPAGAAKAPPVAATPAAAAGPAAAGPAAAGPAVVAPPVLAPPIASPIAKPSGGGKTPFGPDIAPPPFAKPAVTEAPKPEARRRSADPFAAGPAQADQVRLIIDEKPVDESIARRRRTVTMITVAISLVIGLGAGTVVGSANGDRNLYNITVRDGQGVHEVVAAASERVTEAQQHLDAIAASAAGTGGDHHPTVNYDELAALTALEDPLHAGAFARKNYNRFDPATVDDLFNYDHNVHALWEDFTHLNAITTGPARRATLDQTAAATACPGDLGHDDASASAAIQAAQSATTDTANAQYVALIQTTDDGTVQGTLGFAETDFDTTTHEPTARIFMRAGRTGPGRPFDAWAPGLPVTTATTHVIRVDGPASVAVLGDRVGSFRSFAQSLEEARRLMRETMEIQQRLLPALEAVANTPEQFAL